MCRSPSPLDMRPSSSKALLLGSVHATPGVAGPRTPAEWWVLRAWVCFGSGTEFSSEDEEKVYGTLPWECLLLFEAPASVAALILGKDYFISSCFFLSLLFSSLSHAFYHLRFCEDLLGNLLLALALSLHSFPTSPFQSTPIPPPPLSSLRFLCCTPHSFSLSLSPLFYPSNTWQTV